MSKSEDDDYYEVEKILDKKFENEKIFYLVKWKHFPDTDTSWEPEENMQKCTKLVEIFNKEQEKSKDFETCLVAKGQKPKTPSKPKSRKP